MEIAKQRSLDLAKLATAGPDLHRASGSMAPGPEVPGGPFESNKIDMGNLHCISLNLWGPETDWAFNSIREMLWGLPL